MITARSRRVINRWEVSGFTFACLGKVRDSSLALRANGFNIWLNQKKIFSGRKCRKYAWKTLMHFLAKTDFCSQNFLKIAGIAYYRRKYGFSWVTCHFIMKFCTLIQIQSRTQSSLHNFLILLMVVVQRCTIRSFQILNREGYQCIISISLSSLS